MAKRYMHVFEDNADFQAAHGGEWEKYWVSVETDTMRVVYDKAAPGVTFAKGKKDGDK